MKLELRKNKFGIMAPVDMYKTKQNTFGLCNPLVVIHFVLRELSPKDLELLEKGKPVRGRIFVKFEEYLQLKEDFAAMDNKFWTGMYRKVHSYFEPARRIKKEVKG